MISFGRGLAVFILALSWLIEPGGASRSQAVEATNKTSAIAPPSVVAKKPNDPEMEFAIVRFSRPACEPDCPEWIAARGRIVQNTDKKLNAILSSPANRKLPLILNSFGGNIDAALRMGHTLRRYKMTVAVGWTHFDGTCSPFLHVGPPCMVDPVVHVYTGLADEWGATCFSACPFILLGGQKRIVDAGSRLGLHEPITETHPYVDHYWDTWRMINGHKVMISHKFVKRTTLPAKTIVGVTSYLHTKLAPYIKEMGGAPQILDEMTKATPQSMNLISDADGSRVKLGLVTTGFGALATQTGIPACSVSLTALQNCVHSKEKEPH